VEKVIAPLKHTYLNTSASAESPKPEIRAQDMTDMFLKSFSALSTRIK